MNELVKAMPIIVGNYARLFGVRVRMQGTLAYTNGEVITIPRLDLRDRLTARTAYGYLAHEAAHVRCTDFEYVRKLRGRFTLFTIFNILEDSRVERIISREFIGVYENLELLMNQSEDLFRDWRSRLAAQSPLRLVICALLFFVCAENQGFRSQRGKAALCLRAARSVLPHRPLNRFFALAGDIRHCASTAEAAELAQSLHRLLKSFGSGLSGGAPDARDAPPEGRGRRPRPLTQKELRAVCEDFRQEAQADPHGAVPVRDPAELLGSLAPEEMSVKDDMGLLETGICRPGREDFIRLVDGTCGLRRALNRRIRAWCESRGTQCRAGRRLNVRRLARLPAGETRVFENRVLYEDFSTSVHILVDVSGSMLAADGAHPLTRCEEACQAALMLALALEGIDGVQTMVSYFPGVEHECDVALFAHERASAAAARFDQTGRGSTPLAQALWHAVRSAQELAARRGIILVITDGVPDSVRQARQALECAREAGLEICGIGIQTEFVRRIISRSVVIQNASELRSAAAGLIADLFLPSGRAP